MSLPLNYFDVSPTTLHPHEPCSHCSSPYHYLGDCPHWGQSSNFFKNKQLNTSFSSPGFESNSNFYNPDWSNYIYIYIFFSALHFLFIFFLLFYFHVYILFVSVSNSN
jgi:hypothetical protein